MWDVITCIRDDHDLRLVVLAALICVVTSVAAFRFRSRVSRVGGRSVGVWAALTGVVAGGGVWATHFIAMLAYERDLPIRYDLAITCASWAIGVVGLGVGFFISARRRDLLGAIAGGAVIGAGIVALHFVGMAAVQSSFGIQWDPVFVATAVIASLTGGVAACWAALKTDGWMAWIVPPALLLLAIVGLHFTGMTAVTLTPDLTAAVHTEVIGRDVLAYLTGGMAILLLSCGIGLVFVETASRSAGLQHMQLVFRTMPAGLAMFDDDGRLLVWNDAYEAMMGQHGVHLGAGMSRKDILDGVDPQTIEDNEDAGHEPWLSAQAALARHNSPEWRLKAGGWRRAEMHPLPGAGTITILTDITAEKQAAAAMAAAVEEAQAASRAKSDFVANMSHEIRTPLNGVLGMAQVMAADELSQPQRERLQVIRDSGGALLGILNDILDLSKVQAGKLELEDRPFDVLELANATLAAFQGAAAAKGIGLVVDFDPETRRGWSGDALRLRQVLSNLLGNALKFTTEGTVRLEVASRVDHLILRVRDTGIGINEDQIPRLFEKFSQADSTTTRRYGGTGLGLAICEELVGLMGGKISATSQRGRGSCFTVDVALKPADIVISAPAEPEAAEAPGETGDALKVLAAEDNRTNQIVLRSLLQPLGAELTITENGKEAVAAFKAGRFDIVLMDAQMPEMNGVEATLAIRALEDEKDLPRTPIIALSANVMKHQIAEYMEAGMDGWVAKPIELSQLYAAIEQALDGGAPPVEGDTEAEEAVA